MSTSLDSLLSTWQAVRQIGEWILIAGLVGELIVIQDLDDIKELGRRWSRIFTGVVILVSCPGDFVRTDAASGIRVGPAEWPR
jgi:hypothetical protein